MDANSTEIYQILSESNDIALGCHVNPDGDAIGSTLGFALCLSLMGKKPVVLIEDYSEKYSFIKGSEFIFKGNLDELKPDLFISLDCGSSDRLGSAEAVFNRAEKTLAVDHHVSNTNFATYNIVYPESSSTCEVVYEMVKNFCVLNHDIAEALYTGIITDTSCFKHNSTSPRTLEVAAQLIKFGIDFSDIQTRVLYSHTKEETAVFIKAVQKYKIEDKICYSFLTKEEILNDCKADYKDLDGIVEYLLNFEGVEVSVFVYEKPDGTKKISMRSKKLDISKIAMKHNGGGHKLAAGATMNTSVEEAIQTIINEIKNELV